MAMHSYMRANSSQSQSNSINVNSNIDDVNNFLKDKQAWEHAISLYQGPDPLDHWYNYICWYENHLNSDPELKFRETLERCLTVYEHNEYYSQDVRLVRLWLKYIDMQTDPLRFYQVLFHRGTGRQVAAFYIGWASYYEARKQFKDAEAVFNLAFQEKAQSNAELQNALAKFTYVRSLFYQQQQQQPQDQTSNNKLHQLVTYMQSHHQQQEAHTNSLPSTHIRTNQSYIDTAQRYQSCSQEQSYMPYSEQHLSLPAQYHPHHQQAFERFDEQSRQTEYISPDSSSMNNDYSSMIHHHRSSTKNCETEEQEKNQKTEMGQEQAQKQNDELESFIEIEGVRLPRNFQAFGRNNHETWKPALTLEEPDDPSRVCHYAKQLVYPTGTGIEYSPEELLARKYVDMLSKLKKHAHPLPVEKVQQENQCKPKSKRAPYSAEEQKQFDSYHKETQYYKTLVEDELYSQNDRPMNDNHSEGDEREEGVEDEHHPDRSEEESLEENFEEHEDCEATSQIYTKGENGKMHLMVQKPFEQQNLSIKMKFKKERTLESSTYSAYTIESIYHHNQELPSPTSTSVPVRKMSDYRVASALHRQRNNTHNFHPYILGQTSTPKSECENRRSRTKAKLSKFQPEFCSNSNSSCSVADQIVHSVDANEVHSEAAATMVNNATFNDNANFSFSSATGLDNSNSSLALAVDRLHFLDASNITNKIHPHNNNNNSGKNLTITPTGDFSTFQESSYFATQHDIEAQKQRLSKALETITRHLKKEFIDPFNGELCRAFLAKINFPGDSDAHASYKIVQMPLPKISNTRTLNVLESVQFNIDKEVGRGSYGSVYKATDVRTGNVVALKYQKPPNTWEIYICDQVLKRIQDPDVLRGFMDISTAVIAPNASLIATEFSPFGSLLDINNKIRQATTKVMHESLVMHFAAQICNIVDHLHRNHIIHADIKPDNFLLMRVPNVEKSEPSLRLIDFGCAIDMSLFPEPDTKFRKVVQTDGFTCIEMQEGRPWSYETDLFCIASTVHVILFGEYMHPQKRSNGWDIRQKLPRYLKKHIWSNFFYDFLNMKPDKLPQLQHMRKIFEDECYRVESELQKQIRTLSNILHRR